jgi:predicted phosphodiesterase
MGPRVRRNLVLLLVVMLGAGSALATMQLISVVHGTAGPGTVELRASSAWHGTTQVELPPLGRVVASTHAAPVQLEIRLAAIDIDSVQQILAKPDPEGALRVAILADLASLLRRLVIRTLMAGALVGAAVGALVPGRRWSYLALGAVGGLLAVGLTLSWTWQDYDSDAFDEARYEGSLERAPAILEAAGRQVEGLKEVQGLVQSLSGQVAALYAAGETGGVSGETLVLHVSDIHSNPLGLELALRLAESFDVDAVLDTGDLTSFGFQFEASIIELIADLDVPYLWVPGNHDSDANRAAIGASEAVTLLDGDVVSIGELRIMGIADPTYTADNRISTAEANDIKEQRASSVGAQVRQARPAVLAVHDLRQAAAAVGSVPVIVAGHRHERSFQRDDRSLLLTVGSTGATGLGSFTVESEQGYEAQVLRFDGQRLVAIDYVTVRGVTGDFHVERQVIDEPLLGP